MPPALVVFDWHSLPGASHPASVPKGVLVAIERVIFVAVSSGKWLTANHDLRITSRYSLEAS